MVTTESLQWVNNERRIHSKEDVEFPCKRLNYCPYGTLVEYYPLLDRSEYSCPTFGHDCPAYYQAEFV